MNGVLLLVDIQNDFLPGGALAVPRGGEVVAVANRLMPAFPLVAASQDWHPADHISFAASHPGAKIGDIIETGGHAQKLWPSHCVQGSWGAALAPGLDRAGIRALFRKGVDRDIDSYSAFMDNGHARSTGLGEYLVGHASGPLYVMGLATDYCVLYTVLDALSLGWETFVVVDGCRGIEAERGDVERALARMRSAGAVMMRSEAIAVTV